jgi:hypothetical protein
LSTRLGGPPALSFYQEPSKFNYNFCYINANRNYMINYVDKLFQGLSATMFVNNEKFAIHPIDQPCSLENNNISLEGEFPIQNQVHDFLVNTYPKNKLLPLVFSNLVKNNLIDSDLFFIDFPKIHIADFCTFINNRFGKKNKFNVQLLKLCKFIRSKQIKFPSICIKNPIARQALF